MRTGLDTAQSEVKRFRRNSFAIAEQPAWSPFWTINLREGEVVELRGTILLTRGTGASVKTMVANFTVVGQKPTGLAIVAYTPQVVFLGEANPVTQLGWAGSGSTLTLQLRDTAGTTASHIVMEYTTNRRIPS